MNNRVKLSLAFIFLGCALAGWCRLPLIWDGAAYALFMLSSGKAVMIHGRLAAAVFQIPAFASMALGNVDFTISIFSWSYALVPFLLMWGTAVMLKREDLEHLFVLPALQLALFCVWGQAFLVSEALIAVQLFWILALWLLKTPAMGLWAIPAAVFFSTLHPVSSAVLLTIAAGAGAKAFFYDRPNRRAWLTKAIVFAVIAVLRLVSIRHGYETDQLEAQGMWLLTLKSLSVPLICGLVGGVILLIGLLRGAGAAVVYVLAGIITAASMVWALEPSYWAYGLEYRRFFFPLSFAPFVAFMTAWFSRGRQGLVRMSAFWPFAVAWCGMLFCLVIGTQSYLWHRLENVLRERVESMPGCCEELLRAEHFRGTALEVWGASHQSMLLQGRSPSKVLPNRPCVEAMWTKRDRIVLSNAPAVFRKKYVIDLARVGECVPPPDRKQR